MESLVNVFGVLLAARATVEHLLNALDVGQVSQVLVQDFD